MKDFMARIALLPKTQLLIIGAVAVAVLLLAVWLLTRGNKQKGQVKKALRTVELVNGTDLVVTDEITALDSQDCSLEWRMLSISSASASDSGVTLTKNSKKRTLTAVADNGSVNLTYRTWPTTKPTTDGWGVLDFHQTISNRTIVGWSAIVPAGKTVKFVTALKK